MQAQPRTVVQVTIRPFAALRELCGERQIPLAVPEGSRVSEVWQACVERWPALAARRASTVIAVNHVFARPETVVCDGDEVALLPPVSGGKAALIELTERPLDAEKLLRAVTRPSDGGQVVFTGIVRDNNEGQAVRYLEYEAYPEMALPKLEQVAAEAEERWPMANVAMAHRVGHMAIGETSVIVAASAPHRAEAFEAARYAIDRLKAIVPIWKKEFFADGDHWPQGSVPDATAMP